MIGTLTTVFVLLSLLALVLIGVVVYLIVGTEPSGGCPHCGGSGRSVVHDRVGIMSIRCPNCNR